MKFRPFCLAVLMTVSGLQAATIDVGLIAQYKFDGNANDNTGNGWNGQLGLNTVFVPDRFGNPNSALAFNGIADSSIKYENSASMPVNGTSFTVSLWTRLDNFWPGGNAALIVKYGGFGIVATQLEGGAKIFCQTLSSPINRYAISKDISPEIFQLIFSYDGISGKVYLNGAEQNLIINDMLPDPAPYSNNLEVGGNSLSWHSETYFGMIDDIRIYNRALSSNEVSTLYATESVPEPSALSLLAIGLGGLAMMRRRRS